MDDGARPGHEEGAQTHEEVHCRGNLEFMRQGARSLVSVVSRTLGVASSSDATMESQLGESEDHVSHWTGEGMELL